MLPGLGLFGVVFVDLRVDLCWILCWFPLEFGVGWVCLPLYSGFSVCFEIMMFGCFGVGLCCF